MINEDLYNAFSALTIRFYSSIPVDYTGVNRVDIYDKFFYSENAIALTWPEYTTCAKILNEDQRISSLLNKPLSDGIYTGTFGEVSEIIDCFISNCLEKTPVYNEEIFQNHYIYFEIFLYKHICYHIFTVRLYNFDDINHNDVKLTSSLNLLYRPKGEQKKFGDTIIGLSDYVLKCILPVTFVIEDEKRKTVEGPYRRALEALDNFIKSVRLLKETNIYRDEYISHQTTNPVFTGFSGYGIERQKPHLWGGKKTTLTNDEYEELKKTLAYVDLQRDSTNKIFQVALTRFSYAIERENSDDKVIDFMIALEAMYLPDGNSELTFRLTLRASLLLNERSVAKADFDFLKNMYDIRSSIVHGNSSNITKDQIKRLENITRNSLKAFMNDNSQFTRENLNNLFFK
jgi:hypothetical protein